MNLTSISLQNFRNVENANIELYKGVNIFYGDNAQGKTNLLEAVYFCATGRSQRTNTDRDIVALGKIEAHARVNVFNDGLYNRIDVHLKKESKKGIAVNGVPVKRLGDLFGVLLVVIFSPEDLSLIKMGPSERRKYMDIELCQLSPIYYYELQQYYKVLKQRNFLLKDIQKKKADKDSLFVWDDQLVFHGNKIISLRHEFIEKINKIAQKVHNDITNSKEKLQIVYEPCVLPLDFHKKLEKHVERDILQGATSIGIHKDDISFLVNDLDTKVYGSQGQQRTAALSAKLAQIYMIEEEKGFFPVLLLDDVLSELDGTRQKYLIESISHIQTLITCTGVEDLLKKFKEKVNVYRVIGGKYDIIESNS